MALKLFALIFLFALFLSSLHEIQARDSQMFNKIPSKPNEVVVEAKQPEQNLPNKEQENQQPNFIPESTENSYGLYGHESGQFPPSTQTETQTQNNNNQLYQTNPNPQNNFPYNAKYLPKNYNTVAYVTQPEDFNENTNNNNNNNQQTKNNGNNYYNAQNKDLNNEFEFLDNEEGSSVNDNFNNKNSYYNNDVVSNSINTRFMGVSNTPNNNNNNNNNYYNAQQKDGKNEFDFMDNEDNFANDNNNYFNNDASNNNYNNNNNGNSYYNNDVVSNNNNNNFNTRFMDASETNNNNNNYYNSGKNRVNRAEPQGMSDTRFVENGKYHYDINTGKYSRDHPYVSTMAMRNEYNPTNTAYNNVDNSYQYNNYNEDVEQYQNEDNMP